MTDFYICWLVPGPVRQATMKVLKRSLEDKSILEDLATTYLRKDVDRPGGYICSICGKAVRDKYAGKDHLEGKHFPTDGAYSCSKCEKQLNTRKALISHQDHCNFVRGQPGFASHNIVI